MLVFLLRVESLLASLKQRRKTQFYPFPAITPLYFGLENDFEKTTEAKRGISLSLEHCLFFEFCVMMFLMGIRGNIM